MGQRVQGVGGEGKGHSQQCSWNILLEMCGNWCEGLPTSRRIRCICVCLSVLDTSQPLITLVFYLCHGTELSNFLWPLLCRSSQLLGASQHQLPRALSPRLPSLTSLSPFMYFCERCKGRGRSRLAFPKAEDEKMDRDAEKAEVVTEDAEKSEVLNISGSRL